MEPYRKNCFLACKTTCRDKEGAAAELKQSLDRLRTDTLDLYQLHAITDVKEDVEAVFAKGGAMEVFTEAKRTGQVRHLGFSAHSLEAAVAAMDRYDFDSVLFPINFTNYFKGNFGPQLIQEATSRGLSILVLKAMAKQKWQEGDPKREKYSKCWYEPLTNREEAEPAIRFTLSQPITAVVSPGEESLFRLALDIIMSIQPVSDEEQEVLKNNAKELEPIFSNVGE